MSITVLTAIKIYLGAGFRFPPVSESDSQAISYHLSQISSTINKAKQLRSRSGFYGNKIGTAFPEIYGFIPSYYNASNITWDQAITLMSGVQGALLQYQRAPADISEDGFAGAGMEDFGSYTGTPPGPKPKQIVQGFTSYTIKKGDNLTKIAKANNTTVAAIVAINPQIKDPNKIYAGTALKIPSPVSNSNPTGVKVTNTTYTPTPTPKIPTPKINVADYTLAPFQVAGTKTYGGQTLTNPQLLNIKISSEQGKKFPAEVIAQYNKQTLVPKTTSVAPTVTGTSYGNDSSVRYI